MNGPRAGVNFNDGTAGGEILERNLVFNFVRESGDHGMYVFGDNCCYFIFFFLLCFAFSWFGWVIFHVCVCAELCVYVVCFSDSGCSYFLLTSPKITKMHKKPNSKHTGLTAGTGSQLCTTTMKATLPSTQKCTTCGTTLS